MAKVPLPNFSKGEIAPELYGRIDTSQYNAGLKLARNFLVQKYGGVTFRPGTRFVGKIDDPEAPLLFVPFQFSISQSYVLTMQQGIMRPVALGGYVIEQNTKITAITKGATTLVQSPYHGYAEGDRIFFSGIEGMVELNNLTATVVSVPSDDTYRVDIDSTTFADFISADGVTNSAPPPPPPPPPVVPPVVPPPAPPSVGGGGGFDYNWRSFGSNEAIP